jgi:hypothetical protein
MRYIAVYRSYCIVYKIHVTVGVILVKVIDVNCIGFIRDCTILKRYNVLVMIKDKCLREDVGLLQHIRHKKIEKETEKPNS